MTWRDAFGLAGRELRRRAGRSVLTVAAVALAAALLTALVTIAQTAQNRVLSEVTTGGPLAGIKVVAAAPDPTQVEQDNARPGPPRPLDETAFQRIRSLQHVDAVYPIVTVPIIVLAPEQVPLAGGAASPAAGAGAIPPYSDSLVGVPLAQASRLPVTLIAGRLPASANEIAVTPDFLDRLHVPHQRATTVIGLPLEFGFPRGFRRGSSRSLWVHPVIVGVAAHDAGSGQLLGTLQMAETGRDWILAGGIDSAASFGLQPTTYTGLFVISDRLDTVATLRNRITAVGYSTSAPEQLIASVQRYLRVVEIVLGGVGVIALVVATLGIANALFAAVRERRREIGVLKALGARDRDVLRIFLIEAVSVGGVGGLIGAGLGTAVAATVGLAVNRYLASQGVAGLHLSISGRVLLGAVLGAGLLAGLAGLVPAGRAARLPAREAVETG